MAKITQSLFRNFDISLFSRKFIKPEITQQYYKEELKNNNKRTRSDFKISCQNMVLFILLWVLHPEEGYLSVLNKVKSLLVTESKEIIKIISSITDAGLCKARKRFSSVILKKLWTNQVISEFVKEKGIQLWRGFRVFACDGTAFTLSASKELLKKFPPIKTAKLPKMLACVLYDVYSKIPIDMEFSTFPHGEKSLLYKMLARIKHKSLILLDRGYVAFWLFYKMTSLKIDFIIRVTKRHNYKIIKKLGNNDWLIEICYDNYYQNHYKQFFTQKEYDNFPKKIIFRLIKTQLKGFQPRWIVTSLIDIEKYTYKDISKLYGDRWIVENYYRDLKHILKVGKFHSQYEDGIYQEMYAAMILTIILQKYILKAAKTYNIQMEDISFKRTYEILSKFIYILELNQNKKIFENLLLYLIAENRQKKRPGRHHNRVFYRKIKCKSNKWK